QRPADRVRRRGPAAGGTRGLIADCRNPPGHGLGSVSHAVDFAVGGQETRAGPTGAVWATVTKLGAVVRIDPTKNKVSATIGLSWIRSGQPCGFLAASQRAVWAAAPTVQPRRVTAS